MATPFPADIEREILLRLPAKTLRRFTTVCKSWHSLITDPDFISTFHHRSFLNPRLLLLKHPFDPFTGTTLAHFSFSSESFDEGPSTPFTPHLDHHHHDHLLLPRHVELVSSNSVNGIVCVVVHLGLPNGPVNQCDMYLWDASIGKTVKVPASDVTGLFVGHPMVKFYAGFGYDENRDDYKVLRVAYLDSVHATVEVFSVREFSWRKLVMAPHSDILSNILWAGSMCTFVNGVGYWGAFGFEMKDRFFILGFVFGREGFKKIRLPEECIDGREMRYQSLWVFKGLLALSVLHFAEFDSNCTRQYIWVRMVLEGVKKPQWVRLFNIDLEGAPRRPVASLMNGNVLLLGEGDGDHVLYDPELEQVKSLDIFDVDSVVPYVESLVSFDRLLPSWCST